MKPTLVAADGALLRALLHDERVAAFSGCHFEGCAISPSILFIGLDSRSYARFKQMKLDLPPAIGSHMLGRLVCEDPAETGADQAESVELAQVNDNVLSRSVILTLSCPEVCDRLECRCRVVGISS